VRHVAHDISAAVEYLHSCRIIHRDLKPENIVLQDANNGKVLCSYVNRVYSVMLSGVRRKINRSAVVVIV